MYPWGLENIYPWKICIPGKYVSLGLGKYISLENMYPWKNYLKGNMQFSERKSWPSIIWYFVILKQLFLKGFNLVQKTVYFLFNLFSLLLFICLWRSKKLPGNSFCAVQGFFANPICKRWKILENFLFIFNKLIAWIYPLFSCLFNGFIITIRTPWRCVRAFRIGFRSIFYQTFVFRPFLGPPGIRTLVVPAFLRLIRLTKL